MHLCRILAEEKLQAIAEKFNKKDHTTVIAAIDRVKSLMETDEQVHRAVLALTAKLAP
jgi:chromosomal replication initiator protein